MAAAATRRRAGVARQPPAGHDQPTARRRRAGDSRVASPILRHASHRLGRWRRPWDRFNLTISAWHRLFRDTGFEFLEYHELQSPSAATRCASMPAPIGRTTTPQNRCGRSASRSERADVPNASRCGSNSAVSDHSLPHLVADGSTWSRGSKGEVPWREIYAETATIRYSASTKRGPMFEH